MEASKYLFATLAVTAILAGCQEEEAGNNIDETTEEAATGMEESATEESTEENTAEENASGNNDSEEMERTADEGLNAVIDRSDDIESYRAILDLEAEFDSNPSETLDADVRFKDGNPPSMHLQSGGEDRTISKDGETYYHNGTDWVDISDSVGIEQLYHVTYENAVRTLADIGDELEAEADGDTVVYTYDGESQEVFRTFERLFAVNFGSIDTSNVQNSVEIEVGKEESLIQTIEYDAEGEDEEGSFELAGDVEFTSFNDIGEIELPEAVR